MVRRDAGGKGGAMICSSGDVWLENSGTRRPPKTKWDEGFCRATLDTITDNDNANPIQP